MSQQEQDPSRYTRTLIVKPALSQMHDQLLPTWKSLETACKTTALIRWRPVTWVYLDLGFSQTDEGTGNSSTQGTQSLRVEGDQYAILEWSHQPFACEMRPASGYDQEDSSSSPEPRFEKGFM